MNVLFCCYFYSFILYRIFFHERSRFAPICFLFHHWESCSIFLSLVLLSNLWQNGKKLSFLTSWLVILLLFLQIYEFPSHSQPWPKGDSCCTDTLFLSKNLNTSPLALHETGHVYWAEPESRSHNPLILFGHILCVQTSLWTTRGSSVWMYCYCFHSMGGAGVEREGGRGKVAY